MWQWGCSGPLLADLAVRTGRQVFGAAILTATALAGQTPLDEAQSQRHAAFTGSSALGSGLDRYRPRLDELQQHSHQLSSSLTVSALPLPAGQLLGALGKTPTLTTKDQANGPTIIVDENGNEVTLHGIGWYGFNTG